MLRRILAILSFPLAVPSLSAGVITISDSARVSHKVELIAVKVQVDSQCFPSQDEVLKVSQSVGAKIKEIMQSYISTASDSRDRIVASPGFTTRKTVTRYDDDSHRNIVVCENAWAAENTFTLHLANYESWPKLQRDLLATMDSVQAAEVKPAVTTITLAEPVPMLYPETRNKLVMAARLLALESASQQFAKIAESCKLKNYRLAKISSPSASPKLTYAARRAPAGGGDPGDTFLPIFDSLYIDADWQVTYRFVDGGEGCHLAH